MIIRALGFFAEAGRLTILMHPITIPDARPTVPHERHGKYETHIPLFFCNFVIHEYPKRSSMIPGILVFLGSLSSGLVVPKKIN